MLILGAVTHLLRRMPQPYYNASKGTHGFVSQRDTIVTVRLSLSSNHTFKANLESEFTVGAFFLVKIWSISLV
jgi:hypothetical protein